ncbi:hypothetical protein [Streptomyces scabiei]|uniref:hypothetical protein n=1 Tax=Streptomyces scabiei TaxID=1930 RepID=UPI0029B54CDC|nr:hypothetical protein [Streptomyces scabiei]MDX3124937.1 hypothetical protein [Streptomyces scabiei]MDX3201857.1 hypothetical protein [Streptomyces scabiei]MDX3223104.1 hypothetical protein [Streptomyces scabiei]
MPTSPDGEFTELVDATISRVDLVDKAANGLPILMAKQADGGSAGLMDPALVRDLIGKATDPEPAPAAGESVTLTGSPGAIARVIHEAAVRQATTNVTKDADMATDLDPTVVLAEPDQGPQGNPDVPGSPAWEAVDAATARKWTSILSRAKTALGVMIERELLEPGDGSPDDYDGILDLGDAACAIDYAISLLAPFAVDEQAEADCAAEMAAVGKALGGFDSTALDVIESLGQVKKAGRTLSAANELAIRHAVESLQKVLSSLPAAPEPQESGQQVAKKETDMPETAPDTDIPAVDPIGKADGEGDGEGDGGPKEPMAAVYDAKGRLVGIVHPDQITPVSGVDVPDEEEPSADPEPVAEPAALDLDPAPADEVGVPSDEDVTKTTDPATGDDVAKATTQDAAATGDDVTKQTPQTTDAVSDVLKSSITELVKGLLDVHSATQAELITKQGAAVLELADDVETLKGQVRTLEEQPAEPKVLSNGAVPPAPQLRGQDRGAANQIDMAKAAALRNTLRTGTAAEQNSAAVALQTEAIAALREIHGRPAQ